jgi:hypothetical protein
MRENGRECALVAGQHSSRPLGRPPPLERQSLLLYPSIEWDPWPIGVEQNAPGLGGPNGQANI